MEVNSGCNKETKVKSKTSNYLKKIYKKNMTPLYTNYTSLAAFNLHSVVNFFLRPSTFILLLIFS